MWELASRVTMRALTIAATFVILSLPAPVTSGQLTVVPENPTTDDRILSVNFETVPPGLIFRSSEIVLDGNVGAHGYLSVDGEVESTSGGFRFPDGTVQATAAGGASTEQIGSLSLNIGLYSNRIRDISHSASFVEVCFKGGAILNDQHMGGGSTADGSCLPGDVGWIMETNERSAKTWEMAKAHCLAFGMRLPEAFEFKYCCKEAGPLGMLDMTNHYEWAGNTATLLSFGSRHGLAAPLFGAGCNYAVIGWIAVIDGEESSYAFRCTM